GATEPTTQPVASSSPRAGEPNLCCPTRSSASVAPLGVCRADLGDPLTAARKFYDRQEYSEALSCAAKWTALMPEDPQGHSERAAALAALGNLEAAQLAYSRALALAPDQLDALLGAAHLYAVRLPSSRERDELAALYSEKGLSLAKHEGDQKLVEQFALLSAMAFNDLGESQRAYERAEEALQIGPDNTDARYERGLALFELCRFGEATLAFRSLLEDPEHRARAHHQLGLLRERNGHFQEAERHFAQARQLSPDDFPEVFLPSPDAFKAEVAKAVRALPTDMQRDLFGVPVKAEELPSDADLLSSEPPLSPAILGLFRGPPLGEDCPPGLDDCRSVLLYRRNLAHAVRSTEELREQIRTTLLHEIGHLRGEDDLELAARGLE
ncbi:MAG TPA: metallopeptidase family protein, partial [Myxococcaceae bacterium]|nr:metallopeptidase family protein [Myxococcaceae bacterium]